MHLTKSRIQKSFDKAATSYEKVADVQRTCSKILVENLPKKVPINNVLDLGSGTGFNVEHVLQNFPESDIIVNDISKEMLTYSGGKFAHLRNIKFLQGDFEFLDFEYSDLTVSNLAFQWASNLQECIKKHLCRTKVLAFSTLLDGTFKEFRELLELEVTKVYPTYDDINSFMWSLKCKRIKMFRRTFTKMFADIDEFFTYCRELGINNSCTKIPLSKIRRIKSKKVKQFVVTYKVFFAILIR